ncbi:MULTISPECIES: phage tail tube protein [unclassified Streptomyces]|uniref:phage tail tube protein n=1 Tax=unclassified Streptomyces TaxID=2593676 RepID=UPI0006B00D07|nr:MULTISPECIES: hypothetical protein [unclassified Streptomyces]KOX16573.1 hypothetical protein ADL06_33275 [Streptomyces sp. NRRL F-6491]KOX36099.1 hypothetical protein ADL08_33465 [Streptomyces sp. NRRL F-6492]
MSTPPPIDDVTLLARRYRLELDMGTNTPTWTLIPGVSEFAPKIEPTVQELNLYDGEGYPEQVVTMLKWSVETTLAHRANPVTRKFSSSQEALRAASMSFGPGSYVKVRWFDRTGLPDAYEGRAVVQWEPDGGDAAEVDTVKVTLTGSGPLTAITNPVASPGLLAAKGGDS